MAWLCARLRKTFPVGQVFSPRHSPNKFGSALGSRKRSFSSRFSRLGIAQVNSALPSAQENVHFMQVFSPRHSPSKLGSALGLSKTFCYRSVGGGWDLWLFSACFLRSGSGAGRIVVCQRGVECGLRGSESSFQRLEGVKLFLMSFSCIPVRGWFRQAPASQVGRFVGRLPWRWLLVAVSRARL